jgi:WD40 repeat protein
MERTKTVFLSLFCFFFLLPSLLSTNRIWDLKEGRRSLVAHKDAKVTALQFDGNKLVTAASDSTIKAWDLETGNHYHTIEPEKGSGWVRCLQYIQDVMVTGHGDNTLR